MIHSGCSPKQMSENKNDDEIANHVGYLHVVNPATHAGLTRVVKALMAASLDGGTKKNKKQTNKQKTVRTLIQNLGVIYDIKQTNNDSQALTHDDTPRSRHHMCATPIGYLCRCKVHLSRPYVTH